MCAPKARYSIYSHIADLALNVCRYGITARLCIILPSADERCPEMSAPSSAETRIGK
jgi:hypothetical protein